MKKAYQKPAAKKVNFNFEKVVASSDTCGSGIVLTHNPGTECGSMTPNKTSPFIKTASIDPEYCGWQVNAQGK